MLDPTGNNGGLIEFCLGWTMDRRLTGRRGSMMELGPTGMPGPPMIVPEPGLPKGGRDVGREEGVVAVADEAAGWEVDVLLEAEEDGGCCCGGFGEGVPGFCCCRAK